MYFGCIAEHLRHSFSPDIHARLDSHPYELCELAPQELEGFLKKRDFCGVNVTIPYKAAVMPYLTEIDPHAREIGAVNTIVNRNGSLYGYNTDFYGMQALIERLGISLEGRRVAILGTGGTSHTAAIVAKHLRAGEILVVGRAAREGVIDYETLYAQHTDIEVVINTTPCGMYPYAEGNESIAACAIDVSRFPLLVGVVDAVYNPLRAQLVLEARRRGIAADGGLFMLVAQAVRASEIFLDKTYPSGTVERIYGELLRKKENVVLIGMPGSGKSTVGALLAEQTGRRLCDTDALIVEQSGKTISEIFAQEGENAFRALESRVIRETVSPQTGLVIATGGGAILRRENVDALARNGRIYFLDRPLGELLPTPDRPLALDAEAIRRRYEERYDRYLDSADVRICVDGDAASVAMRIKQDFNEEKR